MQFSTLALAALSMGSAIAGAISGAPAYTTVYQSVADVNVVVQQQHDIIVDLTAHIAANAVVAVDVVVQIEAALQIISASIGSLGYPVLELGNAGSYPLNHDQLTTVPDLAHNYQSILVHVEAVANILTALNIKADVFVNIKAELQVILALSASITAHIFAYIQVAAPVYIKVFVQIKSIVVNIQALIAVVVSVACKISL
ncbi:hypothetical protein SAMD00023353_0503320 [Rosellinia necatrix]|uniref:Uncharacterized protein n=1 Tax=Rosellinia necatrix TaxID=77044 RepID=A0A1S7UKU1_ROSNE|nr:hypothetical protein SAMD00023353_0503320 [Rosellinia necatrix]